MLTGLMGDSMIKDTLRSLSCNNGWSYGVLWRFDQKNSLLLTLQDVYCEEQMGALIDNMLPQVHTLGQGVVGQSAYTKEHKWMFYDSRFGNLSPSEFIQSSDAFQDDFAVCSQFTNGIKTIAVISVEPMGVVQFGSTQKLAERLEFVSQTKELFQSIEILQGLALPETEPFSSHSDDWNASGLFASLISCQSPQFASVEFHHGDRYEDFIEKDCPLENIALSFPSISVYERVGPFVTASPLCDNRSNGNISNSSTQQTLTEPSSFFELSAFQGPNSTWSNHDFQESSIFNPICDSELLIDMAKLSQQSFENRMSNQNLSLLVHSTEDQLQKPSNLCTVEELLPKTDFAKASKHFIDDNLFQWIPPMTDESNEMVAVKLRFDLPGASEVVSSSSNPKGHHASTKVISDNQPSTAVQSSITNALNSTEKERGSDTFGSNKRSDFPGMDIGSKIPGNWEDIIRPIDIGSHSDVNASSSDCTSEQYLESKLRTSSTLFSILGLNQRLDDVGRGSCSIARSDSRDQLPSTAKRRKIEIPLFSTDDVSCLSEIVGRANSLPPVYHLNSKSNFESKDNVIRRTETGTCDGSNCSTIVGNIVSSPKKLEQPVKTIKKKAKPGTKPRPKDRQHIHDRLLELRELIPNGEKMSIDRLLHLTIKHLLFLQNVTRHAKRLLQTDEPESGMVRREKRDNSNGVTWACEVGDQTMFCPLIVEDLSIPGQMLIEILCDEQGFFLEIVDIIRGFGLTILKGIMEVRETKIWARFTIEAEENRHVTRHEIFSSLVQLLQLTGQTGVQKSDYFDHPLDGGVSHVKSCQQSALQLPVSLARLDA